MARNTTNTDPKLPKVPIAHYCDAAKLLEFAYGIRGAMPNEAHHHARTALGHAPGVLAKISSFEIPCGQDPTAVVAWAKKIPAAPVDTA